MKKGFTLIELLAVIVILAVILTISIPGISNVISNATKSSFTSDAKLILKAVEYKMMEDSSFDPNTVNETNLKDLLNISNENYEILTIKKMNGTLYITILGKNKWNNLTASGTKTLINVSNSVTEFVRGANTPILADGMTPIKWDGSTWIDTTESDATWYNYDTTNKIWANAKTEDGSMWVWVPRYIYKISSGWHSNTTGTIDIQFTKGVVDNWNKTVIGNIELYESAESSNNTWTNHPAFTFGSEEITGIWVAKFEATASEGVANGYTADGTCPITGDNVTTKTLKILPNTTSWRCIAVGNAFTAIRNMEVSSVYGWPTASGLQANGSFTTDTNNIDTHLMKNNEWGAVAYLSKSSYGKNAEEIYINNSQTYTTGCAGSTVSASGYNGCQNTYQSTGGVKASTTGNIYGIYDMSGGSWEIVPDYIDNANADLVGQGSSIINAGGKYKDIYEDVYTIRSANKKGNAMYESSSSLNNGPYSWFADWTRIDDNGYPFLDRSGAWNGGSASGAYHFINTSGRPSSYAGFRPVLLVNVGL